MRRTALSLALLALAGCQTVAENWAEGQRNLDKTIRGREFGEEAGRSDALPDTPPVPGEPPPAVASATPAGPARRKAAALPLQAVAVPTEIAGVMDELVLGELQKEGFEAIGRDDIQALLGLEQQKTLLGCDEGACMAEIGNALGVQYLVSGKLASIDTSLILTLKLIDVKKARVLARTSRTTTAGKAELPGMIGASVKELVASAP